MDQLSCSNCGTDDLNPEYRYCPYCGTKLAVPGLCPNCGAQNAASANFCQDCGSNLKVELIEQEDEKPEDFIPIDEMGSPPNYGLTIEFGYSTSANFDRALRIAEEFETYIKYGEGKNAIHRVTFNPDEIEDSIDLQDYVGGWKSAKLYFEGEEVTSQSIYGFSWCYEQRKASFKPEMYCFGYENDYQLNLWGCIQAQMPWMDRADWLTYGEFTGKKGEWRFDKERIRHKLQQELHSVRFCPAFNADLVEDVLNALPDTVDPTRNDDWKFIEDWSADELSGGLKVTYEESGFERTVMMKGVAPRKGAIEDIAKKLNLRLPS